jgi:hypothetical protein
VTFEIILHYLFDIRIFLEVEAILVSLISFTGILKFLNSFSIASSVHLTLTPPSPSPYSAALVCRDSTGAGGACNRHGSTLLPAHAPLTQGDNGQDSGERLYLLEWVSELERMGNWKSGCVALGGQIQLAVVQVAQ